MKGNIDPVLISRMSVHTCRRY